MASRLARPDEVVWDSTGGILVAAQRENKILRVDLASGALTTVAGTGEGGLEGDGGPATGALLSGPEALALAGDGTLYIADTGNSRIRRVDRLSGIIETVAGSEGGYGGDGSAATRALLSMPRGVALDGYGNLFIGDTANHVVRRVDLESGIITNFAGNGEQPGHEGDGGPATAASLAFPYGLELVDDSTLLVADTVNKLVRSVDLSQGVIATVAGSGDPEYNGDGFSALEAGLGNPRAVAQDSAGNLYIADTLNNRIRRVDPGTGLITTVAGNGEQGFSGDGGVATGAALWWPYGVAGDDMGNLYFSEFGHHRIRHVDPEGIIQTVAGTGEGGTEGDGGPALEAAFAGVAGLALDSSGNLYIADLLNDRIRAVRGPIP